jgi:NAD(P)-dependent dehydrogenase (short-subunit alcohol dehydrogenase family)
VLKIDLDKYASTITAWVCDVKNEWEVRSTIHEVAIALGGIDLLINNAGEIVVGPLEGMKREDFQNAAECNGRPHEAHRPLVTSNASSLQEQTLHWLGMRIVFLSFFAHVNC